MRKHDQPLAGRRNGPDKGNPHGAPPGRYGPKGTGDVQRSGSRKKGKR